MKSKNCKCFACGNDLKVMSITENSHIAGMTMDGKLISVGSYTDNEVVLQMRCIKCNTDYIISGYKHDLKNLLEW